LSAFWTLDLSFQIFALCHDTRPTRGKTRRPTDQDRGMRRVEVWCEGYYLETGSLTSGVWVSVRLFREDASQVRSDRFAQLSSGTRPIQVRCPYLPRCQHLLNGSQKRRSCLLLAQMVEQELP
jgi:hypothetical protein